MSWLWTINIVTILTTIIINIIIWFEASLQPNIGNTLWRILMVFTGSGITPPKVNRFGWNLEHSKGLSLADFEHDPRSSESWTARWNFVFLSGKQHDFTDFPLTNFTKFEHNTLMNASGTEFWEFSRKGSFFPKECKKIWNFFQHLATSGRHNCAMITDQWKFITKWPSVGYLVCIFTIPLESIQSHSSGLYTPYKKPPPNFLRRRTQVDGTADNADISQLQAATADRLLSHVTLGRVECRK